MWRIKTDGLARGDAKFGWAGVGVAEVTQCRGPEERQGEKKLQLRAASHSVLPGCRISGRI